MERTKRPFNPKALKRYAIRRKIRPPIGSEGVVYRYTLLVPIQQLVPGRCVQEIATADDLERLEEMLADHFGGVTTSTTVPAFRGRGARDPKRPEVSRETNTHASFVVYAAAIGESDAYFRALRHELEEALAEGIILVERQDVTFL